MFMAGLKKRVINEFHIYRLLISVRHVQPNGFMKFSLNLEMKEFV